MNRGIAFPVKSPQLLTAICLLFACSSSPSLVWAQESKGKLIKVEYDSTKDITQITLNPFPLASRKFEELRLGAVAGYPGKVRVKPKEVALIFISLSTSDASKYQAARKLTVTLDGDKLTLGEAQYSKQSQGGLFMETMPITIPMDVFLRMSGSNTVSIKLGFTEVKLTTEQIEILRIAASYMTE